MYRVLILSLLLLLPFGALAKLHDPTQPPWAANSSAGLLGGDLVVKSIVVDGSKKEVLIGSRYLSVGDSVGAAKIVEIDAHQIKLKTRGEVITVPIFKPVEKKGVKNVGDKS